MKLTLLLSIASLFAAALSANAGDSKLNWPSEKGWKLPAGRLSNVTTQTDSDLDPASYRSELQRGRTGIDLQIEAGIPVCAIADGLVVRVWRRAEATTSAVMVKHQSSAGSFFATYGRIAPMVKEGQVILGGRTPMGMMGESFQPTMLHLGINIRPEVADFIQFARDWDGLPESVDPAELGWVDPILYLSEFWARSFPKADDRRNKSTNKDMAPAKFTVEGPEPGSEEATHEDDLIQASKKKVLVGQEEQNDAPVHRFEKLYRRWLGSYTGISYQEAGLTYRKYSSGNWVASEAGSTDMWYQWNGMWHFIRHWS